MDSEPTNIPPDTPADTNSFLEKVKQHFVLITVVTLLLFGSFGFGAYIGFDIGFERNIESRTSTVFANDNILTPVGVDFTPLWTAWHAINEKYVPASTTDPVADVDKVWGAIQGLARSLGDPYTVFLPPEDASIFEDDISGNFESSESIM